MTVRGFAIVLMLFAISYSAACCSSLPAIDISHPIDGGYVTNRTVNLTGHAPGTEVRWQQSQGSGFEEASLENLLVDSEGNLTLRRTIWDDFDDGTLDLDKWAPKEMGGLEVIETAGELHMKGTQNTTTRWKGYAGLTSASYLGREFAINLTSLSGTGTGFLAEVILYKDSSHFVGLGLGYDATVHSTRDIYHYYIDSTFGNDWSGRDRESSHRFTIRHYGDDWDMVESDGYGLSLGNFKDWVNIKLILCVYTRANSDTVKAIWDDAFGSYYKTGIYTSTIRDIGADGMPMRNASWDTNMSGAGFVKVEVRSSSNANMSGASSWTTLSNNQTTGLPNLKRYVQSRITLQSDFYCRKAPSLRVLNLTYRIPVTRVDFSTDGRYSWQWANGTDPWYAIVTLSEGPHTIWARAVDILGMENESITRFVVDVTPPSGGIVLNDGEELTADPLVRVQLSSYDLYGVTEMILSEYESFYGSVWQPYCNTATLQLMRLDGPHTVYARFMDAHSLISNVTSDTIHLDTSPPVGGVSINAEAALTNSTHVVLDLWAEDLCGVADVRISEAEDLGEAAWMPFEARIDWTLSPGDGRKHVYASFRDALGHASGPVSDTIFLDTTPPTVNMTINGGASYTGMMKVSVSLGVYDQSTLDRMQIGEGSDLTGRPVEPFVRQLDWTFSSEEGERTLFVRVWDAAGNGCPPVSASIILDLTGPLLELKINGGASATNNPTIVMGVGYTDALPVEGLEIGDGPDLSDAEWTEFAPEVTWMVEGTDGVKEVFCRGRDIVGNVGPIASAIILLDTIPPLMSVTVDGGLEVTNASSVHVRFKVQDASGAATMQIGTEPTLDGVGPVPAMTDYDWDLAPGDGPKTLYVRVRDLAGNRGDVVLCSILLDTIPPVADISPLPSRVRSLELTVQWSGEDAGSGVVSYDVQYLSLEGEWSSWLKAEDRTSATFAGEDGESYSFRVRALDRAGNVGQFSDPGSERVLLLLPRPLVSIDRPLPDGNLSGYVIVKGTATHEDVGSRVVLVEVSVDGGPWQSASGTSSWEYALDLSRYPEGPIRIDARASDGTLMSPTTTVQINVVPSDDRVSSMDGTSLIFAVVISFGVVLAISFYLVRRRKRSGGIDDVQMTP